MRKLVGIWVTSSLALCVSWGCGSATNDPSAATGGDSHAGGNHDAGASSERGGAGSSRGGASGGVARGGHDSGGIAGADTSSGGSSGGIAGDSGEAGSGGDIVDTGGVTSTGGSTSIGTGGSAIGGTSTGGTTGGTATGGAGTGGVASGGVSNGGTSGGVSTGGVSTGGTTGGTSTGGATGGVFTGGVSTGGTTGGASTGGTTGGVSTGGVSTGGTTGGASTGGVSTGGTTGGTSSGGTGTGGAPSCGTGTHACGASCVADGAPGTEFVHAVYGCGHRFTPATGSGDWVSFESGLNVDEKTGYGWYQASGSHTQAEGIAICASGNIAGINSGWSLPTIDQARTLAAGCPDTAPGGTCTISDPSCLLNTCAAGATCESCLGSAGPNMGRYCRDNVRLCANLMSSSVCPNCTSPTTVWMYGASNGNFVLVSSGSRYTHLCVRTSVPNY